MRHGGEGSYTGPACPPDNAWEPGRA
jgi:hypothetical protein